MATKHYNNLPQLGAHDQGANSEERGFACIFAEPPPHVLQTECPICHLIIRDPHQVTCCGNSFCHSCIQRIKDSNKPCPICKTKDFSDFLDKRLKQNLNVCKVYCTHKKDGCEWTGELGQLEEHLNKDPQPGKEFDGCQFVEVNCSFECGGKFQRQQIRNHETEECPKRQVNCKHCHNYESDYDDVVHNHWPVCGSFPVHCPNQCGIFLKRQNMDNHVHNQCPLTVISCDFHHVGCTEKLLRKRMPEHLDSSLHMHMSLLATSHAKQQAQIASLIAENKQLQKKNEHEYEEISSPAATQSIARAVSFVSPSTVMPTAPPTLIMTVFSKHKKNKDRWHSPPIYTHPQGYKICLRVEANGVDTGKGTHVSVHVIFLRGEYDDYLKWPFRGLVSFQLIDQVEGKSHAVRTLVYDDTVREPVCSRVMRGEMGVAGLGIPQFIAHSELEPRYLQKNSLFFQIFRVELNRRN